METFAPMEMDLNYWGYLAVAAGVLAELVVVVCERRGHLENEL